MSNTSKMIKAGVTVYKKNSSDEWEAIAYAQSFSEDYTVETQEVVDLGDANADYSNPEPTKKSIQLSVSAIVLKEEIEGKTDGRALLEDLKNDKTLKLLVGDSADVTKDGDDVDTATEVDETLNPIDLTKKQYTLYDAILTGYNRSANVNEYHTYDATFSVKGKPKTMQYDPAV